MRTTLDVPDAMLRQLKARAAFEGTALESLVLSLIDRGLKGLPGRRRNRLRALSSCHRFGSAGP